jgi:hypothetical protein
MLLLIGVAVVAFLAGFAAATVLLTILGRRYEAHLEATLAEEVERRHVGRMYSEN